MTESLKMESLDMSEKSDEDNKWDDRDDSPFLEIPFEMFLHICSFLETKDLVCSLAYVCKRFYELLQDQCIYKSWIAAKWGKPYPMLESVDDNEVNWKEAAFFIEKESKIWTKGLRHHIIRDTHLSNADAVMFLNGAQYCVTASRDQFMALWKLPDCDNGIPNVVEIKKAHVGWVWRIMKRGDYIYSASWDCTIKEWLWQEGFTERNCLKSRPNAPILCLSLDNRGLIYGGSIAKFIQCFDPRVKSEPIFSLDGHRRSVLTLETFDEDIISGSEDKNLIIWDTKMRKPREKISLGDSSYPLSCDKLGNVLYVADSKGNVRALSYHSGSLTPEKSFEVGHSKLVTTVKVTRGAMVTAGLDGVARSHLILRPPVYIGSAFTAGGEASGMDYCDGNLAIGTASTVEFWAPAHSDEEAIL